MNSACGHRSKPYDGSEETNSSDSSTRETATHDSDTDTNMGTDVIQEGLFVGNPAARACDIVLTAAGGTRISAIAFQDDVLGKWDTRAPNTAISLMAKAEEPFPTPVAQLERIAAGSQGSLSVASATCFDSQGKQISKPEIIVQ